MSLTVAFVYMIDNSTAVYVATRGVTDKVDFFGHLSVSNIRRKITEIC